MLVDNIFFNSMSIPLLIQMLHHLLSHHANQFYFPDWLLLREWKPQWQNFTPFKKKKLLVIYHRHLKLGNWQPHVNLLHVTDQCFLLDCITCILFLIILQLGPYLRFWIGCMYSFYTFVKSYYWKQIFYVMSILCTFNM